MFLLPDLSQRNFQPEIMDEPGLDADQHKRALTGLRTIDFLSGSARLIWPAISKLAREMGTGSLRLLDVASGGGDVPIALWRKARRRGIRLTIVGCDVSPVAVLVEGPLVGLG